VWENNHAEHDAGGLERKGGQGDIGFLHRKAAYPTMWNEVFRQETQIHHQVTVARGLAPGSTDTKSKRGGKNKGRWNTIVPQCQKKTFHHIVSTTSEREGNGGMYTAESLILNGFV